MPDAVGADVSTLLDGVAAALTPGLQDMAEAHDWPEDVVERLSVIHMDGALVPHYEGNQQEVDNLEYGGIDTAPRAAISNFFNSHAVQRDIGKVTKAHMGSFATRINGAFS